MRFFLFLCILFLAPDFAFATSYEYSLGPSGVWQAAPIGTAPPPTDYAPSDFPSPLVDSAGNITGTIPTANLPVPSDPSGIPGISENSLIKVGDLAATLAPYLAQLAALSPQARVAIGGASALWNLWQAYYSATNPYTGSGVSSSSNGCFYCTGVPGVYLAGPFPAFSVAYESQVCGGPITDTGAAAASCTANMSYPADTVPADQSLPGVSGSSTATVPAPTTAELVAQLNATPADSLTYLDNLPSNLVSQIPVTQTLTGPSTFVEPSNISTSTDSLGNVTTTTSTITDSLTYSGPTVTDSQATKTVTQVCTASGSCSSTVTQSQPDPVSPFIAPPVNFGPSGLSAAVQGMNTTMPFSSIGFGSSWLPQSCVAPPTWQVELPFGGFNQTFTLPTDVLCTLASDMRPFVLAGGGVLALMILAW
ncbi:virulence factor TspB C-terminal domain-related protein [Acidithiobacillus sulfuriphilus]|uniref:virulence factor TspB C-terminal domain-related protein n=1 Tax=Acidithiobacillus sulfuriphilus TaxID=1867749 RepID=UPI003F60707D